MNNILKCIFLKENIFIFIQISQVNSKGPELIQWVDARKT